MVNSLNLINFVPAFAKFHANIIPSAIQEPVINFVLNKHLAAQINDGELDFLAGKWLEIKVDDMEISCYFTFDLDREKVNATFAQTDPDVSIVGQFNHFVLLASQSVDPDTLFFKRKLLIEGDTELGLAVKNMLDCIELDEFPSIAQSALNHYSKLVQSS